MLALQYSPSGQSQEVTKRYMAKRAHIGESELEVLVFIAERSGATVREAADAFAQSHGFVRTTLLQMMERLRKKGYLIRESINGIFQYRSTMNRVELDAYLVKGFVERSLGGSVTPFVAYLADHGELSSNDLDQLRLLVDSLEKDSNMGRI